MSDDSMDCRSYTHTRRFPLAIGNIGDFQLPVPVTISQAMTIVGSFVGLMLARDIWSTSSILFNVIVLLGVPAGLGRVAKRPRVEGRPLLRYMAGWCDHLVARGRQEMSARSTGTRVRCRAYVPVVRDA